MSLDSLRPAGDIVQAEHQNSLDAKRVCLVGTSKALLSAAINLTGSGDGTIISADASNKIKVVGLTLVVGGETNITFKDGTTALSGAVDLGGTSEPRGMVNNGTIECPILETSVNKAFVINSSSAVQVSGWLRYFKEA